MIIGFDASRVNIKNKTGVENYSLHLLQWLKKIDKENTYNLYTPKAQDMEFFDLPKNFVLKEIPFPRLWTQIRLALQLKKEKPDILFIPSHVMPYFTFGTSCVVTIHDVAWRYFPENYSFVAQRYLEFTTRYALEKAEKVITISNTTKEDLIKFYGADEDKIKVVHLGFEPPKKELDHLSSDKWDAYKDKFKINKEYILYIGRIETKKNLTTLVKTFYEILSKGQDLQLILAGKRGVGAEKIDSLIEKYNLRDRVIMAGYISEEEKYYLLKKANIFLFLSRYEGFGLPILEAFYAGVPVVASRISVFEELYDDALLLVNPYKTDEISTELFKLIKNKNRQERMVRKGKEILQNFSWEKCARETLEILNSLNKE